jgi:hypothetical protein
MAFESIQKLFCCHAASSEPRGHFGDHTAVPGGKPFTFILMLLGLGGMGVGILGLGVHQGWWNSGTLSQLSQVDAIAMMSSGFAGGVIGISWAICRMKLQTIHDGYQILYSETKLSDKLVQNSFSYVLEGSGKTYTMVTRNKPVAKIMASGLTLEDNETAPHTWEMIYVTTSLIPSVLKEIRSSVSKHTQNVEVLRELNKILEDKKFISDPAAYMETYKLAFQTGSLKSDTDPKKQAIYYILCDRRESKRF